MSYADSTFYIDTYGGTTIPVTPPELIGSQLRLASRAVDAATMYRIRDFDELTAFQQLQVKLGVCAQADYSFQYGALSSLLGLTGSYSIGDVSMSGKSESGLSAEAEHYQLCDEAIKLLMPTGLLNRGI